MMELRRVDGALIAVGESTRCIAETHRANLWRANLWGANLQEAHLQEANLWRANLHGAHLEGAHLWRANLQEAHLEGAHLEGAHLEGADLEGARLAYPALSILRLQHSRLYAWKYIVDGRAPYYRRCGYTVGQVYFEENFDSDDRMICARGINVATLQWCLLEAPDGATFIEGSFSPKDIVSIPLATDGKFRVRKLKVLREITRAKAEELLKKCFSTGEKQDG